jgi:hypothetical protein
VAAVGVAQLGAALVGGDRGDPAAQAQDVGGAELAERGEGGGLRRGVDQAEGLQAGAQLGQGAEAGLAGVARGARGAGEAEQAGDRGLMQAAGVGAGVGEGAGEALGGPAAHAEQEQRLAEVEAGLRGGGGAGGVLEQIEEDDRGALAVLLGEHDLAGDEAARELAGAAPVLAAGGGLGRGRYVLGASDRGGGAGELGRDLGGREQGWPEGQVSWPEGQVGPRRAGRAQARDDREGRGEAEARGRATGHGAL